MLGLPRPPASAGAGLEEWERQLYDDRAVARTDRLTALGFTPSTSFAAGISHVTTWAGWAGLLG
jgi:hypothetical protein